jgi:hypothetical protein
VGQPDGNPQMLKETNVGFVRIWVWWSLLQPNPGYEPGTENVTNWPYDNDARRRSQPSTHRQSLDDQLMFLKGNGDPDLADLKVILAIWRFPSWCNQTTIANANVKSYHYEGDVSNGAAGPLPNPHPTRAGFLRADNFAIPDTQDVNSPFASFVYWLAKRYTKTPANPTRWADAIEICNEPNGQWWPQGIPSESPNGEAVATSHCAVSNMMASSVVRRDQAMADLANEGNPPQTKPFLLAPATDDYYCDDTKTPPVFDTDARTSYATFTNNLASLLTASRFTAPTDMIWSHHNYSDMSFDYGTGTTYPGQSVQCPGLNRAQYVRDNLIGRWTGGPYGDANAPYVFLTEGGVLRSGDWKKIWFGSSSYNTASGMDAKHGVLMQKSLDRMQNEEDGQGIGMMTQYLNWTQGFDSGIRNPPDPTGAKRQPAYDIWSGATSHPRWGD